MPNLTVPYQRGNLGLQTLVAERIDKWGKPARYSEYVTGYKSAGNFSGHNPDSNGIVHAVDIFVGPGNLTPAQGVELYDAVRREGVRGNTDGHPKRTTYVIHNRLISGDFNDWTNEAYTGPDPHTDHVHVSTHDGYWGDPLPASFGPDDYDSTLTWSLNTITGQGSGITPITEDTFMPALSEDEQRRILAAADRIMGTIPDRRDKKGNVAKVAMDDNTFSKADGAYQNTLTQRDMVPAIGRIENALGTKPDKTDLAAAILAGGSGDPSVIAKAVIDAVGDGLAKEVVDAIGAALSGGGK